MGLLLDLGLCTAGGMGPAPLGWADLAHWQRLTGEPLQPWQARALRQASAAYVTQLADAADPGCPAPWANALAEDDRKTVARQIGAALSSRARGTA